jgi:predicted membrane protein
VRGRIVAGLILVLVGIALLLDVTGYAQMDTLLETYWPVILIVLGLVQFTVRPARPLGGFILLAVGAVFLLDALGVLPHAWFNYVWPLGIVFIGLLLILGRPRRRWEHRHEVKEGVVDDDLIQRKVVFGGIDERVRSQNFRGGDVEVTFGGAKLDLRDARISAQGARLDLSATFGGIEILLPPNWNVRVESRPVLGGVENKINAPGPGVASGPFLDIRASATFGGVTLRN